MPEKHKTTILAATQNISTLFSLSRPLAHFIRLATHQAATLNVSNSVSEVFT